MFGVCWMLLAGSSQQHPAENCLLSYGIPHSRHYEQIKITSNLDQNISLWQYMYTLCIIDVGLVNDLWLCFHRHYVTHLTHFGNVKGPICFF